MASAPHLFEDLHLTNNAGEVNGIGNGLAIKGKGIFKVLMRTTTEKFTPSRYQTVSTYLG
jgi:hypothetical protein